MEFTLTFDCDNDAFADDPSDEIARILDNVARRVNDGARDGKIMDVNGNTVGNFTLTGTPD